MDFATSLTDLDTVIGDGADTTFSTSEKTRAMTRAWNDSYVVNTVWDDSLSFSTGTYQYTLPDEITTVKDIYISTSGATQPFPEPIDNSLWELVNGVIQFNQLANNVIPNGFTLYLKGHYKIDPDNDTLDNVNLQEYVLALGGVYTLNMLTHKKANLFTKNDVSVSELIGIKRELQNDVTDLRRRLAREWESA